jgi:hypothetical protein
VRAWPEAVAPPPSPPAAAPVDRRERSAPPVEPGPAVAGRVPARGPGGGTTHTRIAGTPLRLQDRDLWVYSTGDHVHQATDKIAAQLDCDVSVALGRLRIRADATGQTLEHMALDVLDGVARFDK